MRTFLTTLLFLVSNVVHSAYLHDTDLISLHFDNTPNDAHAAVAGLMVSQKLDLRPHVVGGTSRFAVTDNFSSGPVMDVVWNGEWVNTTADWDNAVSTTAARWLEAIKVGGNVYVAEGRYSDFSADVIRQVKILDASVDTRERIILVQQRDEQDVSADSGHESDLSYVQANANYTEIPDGKVLNGTADLKGQSTSFVTRASSSTFAEQWSIALSHFDTGGEIDFSSMVELLYILDIGTSRIASIDDFADEFFITALASDESSIPDPTSRTGWSDSYSVDGQCYCDTNFDHDLDAVFLDTPVGQRSVPQICADITACLLYTSPSPRD